MDRIPFDNIFLNETSIEVGSTIRINNITNITINFFNLTLRSTPVRIKFEDISQEEI